MNIPFVSLFDKSTDHKDGIHSKVLTAANNRGQVFSVFGV